VLDYHLAHAADGPVSLDVLDDHGGPVRRFSSADPPDSADTDLNIPTYWIRPRRTLSTSAGMHRFVWDLHGPARRCRVTATPSRRSTATRRAKPRGAWVLPGRYSVRLSVGGRTYSQPLEVRMDPRVAVTRATLQRQFTLAQRLVQALDRHATTLAQVRSAREALKSLRRGDAGAPSAASPDSLAWGTGSRADSLKSLDREAAEIELGAGVAPGPGSPENLTRLGGELTRLYQLIEGADAAPTDAMTAAVAPLERSLEALRLRVVGLEGRVRSVGAR